MTTPLSFSLPPLSPSSTPFPPRAPHLSFTTRATPTPTPTPTPNLLTLLRQRKTEEAYQIYENAPELPDPTCLSRLVSQLSYQNTPSSFSRAQSILTRLRLSDQLHLLDSNSLGLLVVSAVKFNHTRYALALLNSMISSNYLPHLKAWSSVVSKLAASPDDGPLHALNLFWFILKRLRRFEDPTLVASSLPDTGAFNGALNACANLGDFDSFCHVFDEMPQFGVVPDALTYNVVIKLCARVGRKDLLVSVLELMLSKGVQPCVTTLHSLVAAYIGFGDLGTAERLVQALREGRRDVCKVLRDAQLAAVDDDTDSEDECCRENELGDDAFDKIIPRLVRDGQTNLLLPRTYKPNSRMYTTLMKGYMKAGRVADTVRMLEAMRHQEDSTSHPDHVSYTTVISALVKAGSMDRARQVLVEMKKMGVAANLVTYNVLLKGYCQQLQIEKAKNLMREMTDVVGILPDVVSYNTLIDGCILVDDSAGALEYFNEMRVRGIAPTKISYTTLMKAFALSGQPKLANKVFDEMLKDPRVKADQVAWNMLVEGYCRMGLIEEAKKVVERMRDYGYHPNVSTYGSLANGIALARKPGEALLLWNEVKERCAPRGDGKTTDPSVPPRIYPDEGLLDTLADICVRAAFFIKALEIVACMEENGISPNKTKFTRIYVEMHSRMFTSKHASQARQDRRRDKKRAAEAFKFWLGLPNEYYGSEWNVYHGD
ncbi:hypothetical protein vseg_003648 [Gypsophila vaccaria]